MPGTDRPSLVVELRYDPNQAGFDAGIAATGNHVFVGAGARVLCYEHAEGWRRLWTESLAVGFLSWAIHDDVVIMSAELALAAWDRRGQKLWSTFVEPPWDYQLAEDLVRLDVMGTISIFDLHSGPAPAG